MIQESSRWATSMCVCKRANEDCFERRSWGDFLDENRFGKGWFPIEIPSRLFEAVGIS